MGNNSPKSNKRKHIYDELSKKIDSFNSNDEYPLNENEIWSKKKDSSILKSKRKYEIKKRKKIETDLEKELIESSILISDFLSNNLISKQTNRRALPDTNAINSLLLLPDLFGNEKEGIKFNKQIDYCEQIMSKGINDFKKGYIKHLKKNKSGNKRAKNENEDSDINDEINILKEKNNYLEKSKNKENIINNNYDYDKQIRKSIDNNNKTSPLNYNNEKHNIGNYLYKHKKIKNFISPKNKIKNKFLEDDLQIKEGLKFNETNSSGNTIKNKNKLYIGKDKENFIRKKIYLNNSPKITAFKTKDNEDKIDLKDFNYNHKKYFDDINNTQIYNNINNMNNQNKRDFSYDNIKKYKNNEIKIKNKELRKKIREDNLELNKTQDIINKNNFSNGINETEKNFFNLKNTDNNNINQFDLSKNKIEKSTNFNIIKNTKGKNKNDNSLFNIKNNIELENKHTKSKNNNQIQNIRESLDYVKNKENIYIKNDFNNYRQGKINNIKNDSFLINGADYNHYNLTNVSNRSKGKKEIERKNKKIKINNKNASKRNVIVIDLRKSKSYDKHKK